MGEAFVTDAERQRLVSLEAVLIELRGKVAQALKSGGMSCGENRHDVESRLGWLAHHIDGMIDANDIGHDAILEHRSLLEDVLIAEKEPH
nr:hypothetical protein [uncultured Neokomagataea sp.]